MANRIGGRASAGMLALALAVAGGAPAAADGLLQETVEFTGTIAFISAGVPGMVMAAVKDGETAFAGFGETRKGSGIEPDADTMLRIGSISKTFCGEALGSLALDGTLKLTDPVQAHLGPDFTVPAKDGRALRLIDVITQSSGLPREVPNQTGGTPDNPFAGNTPEAQAAALADDPFLFAPGTGVFYSNFAHDLLGAALAGPPASPMLISCQSVCSPRAA